MEDKLTIVGPEPDDSRNNSFRKKVNVEALLLMARYNKKFRKKLITDRKAAIEQSGLTLSRAEKLLLNSISNEKLEQNIKEFRLKGINRKSLPSWTRAVSVVMLISTLATSVIGCPSGPITRGVEPDDDYYSRQVTDTNTRRKKIQAKLSTIYNREKENSIEEKIEDTEKLIKDPENTDNK